MLLAPGEETLGDRTFTLLFLDELTCDEGGNQVMRGAIRRVGRNIQSSLLVPSESFGARVTSSGHSGAIRRDSEQLTRAFGELRCEGDVIELRAHTPSNVLHRHLQPLLEWSNRTCGERAPW